MSRGGVATQMAWPPDSEQGENQHTRSVMSHSILDFVMLHAQQNQLVGESECDVVHNMLPPIWGFATRDSAEQIVFALHWNSSWKNFLQVSSRVSTQWHFEKETTERSVVSIAQCGHCRPIAPTRSDRLVLLPVLCGRWKLVAWRWKINYPACRRTSGWVSLHLFGQNNSLDSFFFHQ